jgi:hypothetical protein
MNQDNKEDRELLWQAFISDYYSSGKAGEAVVVNPMKFINWMRENFNPPK